MEKKPDAENRHSESFRATGPDQATDPVSGHWHVDIIDDYKFTVKHSKGFFNSDKAYIESLMKDVFGSNFSSGIDSGIYFSAVRMCPSDDYIYYLIVTKSDHYYSELLNYFNGPLVNYSHKNVNLTLMSLDYVNSCSLTMCGAICDNRLLQGSKVVKTYQPTTLEIRVETIKTPASTSLLEFKMGGSEKFTYGPYSGPEPSFLFELSTLESAKISLIKDSDKIASFPIPKLVGKPDFGYNVKITNRSMADIFYKFGWVKSGGVEMPIELGNGLGGQKMVTFKLTSDTVTGGPITSILFGDPDPMHSTVELTEVNLTGGLAKYTINIFDVGSSVTTRGNSTYSLTQGTTEVKFHIIEGGNKNGLAFGASDSPIVSFGPQNKIKFSGAQNLTVTIFGPGSKKSSVETNDFTLTNNGTINIG